MLERKYVSMFLGLRQQMCGFFFCVFFFFYQFNFHFLNPVLAIVAETFDWLVTSVLIIGGGWRVVFEVVATFSRMVVVCTFCVLTGSIVLPNHLEMLLLFNTAVHLSAGLGRLDYLTTHTSLSPIRRGFAPDFVNYKKGTLDSQPQMIKLPVACPWSVVLFGYSDFFHQ